MEIPTETGAVLMSLTITVVIRQFHQLRISRVNLLSQLRTNVVAPVDLHLAERVLQHHLHLGVARHAGVAHVEHKVVAGIQHQGSCRGNVSGS